MNAGNYPPVGKTPAGIKTGWWSFELPEYRPHPNSQIATYSLFSFDELPPVLGQFDYDYQWLKSQPVKEGLLADGGYNNGEPPDLGKLSNIIDQLNLQPPRSFLTFVESIDLHKRIRSCTDCYLDVADFAVRNIGEDHSYLIHFLSDSQWILHWYIHIGNSGDHFVVASPNAYGFAAGGAEDRSLDLAHSDIWFCAPSFTEFIYRFWLENEIWFASAFDKQPLTALQQAYVDHYVHSK
jgi:hypothetical protein